MGNCDTSPIWTFVFLSIFRLYRRRYNYYLYSGYIKSRVPHTRYDVAKSLAHELGHAIEEVCNLVLCVLGTAQYRQW